MMRLSLVSLLLALFAHKALASTCPVCGSGYTMQGSGSFFAGVSNLSCDDLVSFAGDRGPQTDVCGIIQSYARTHCDCRDFSGNSAPPLPFLSNTVQWCVLSRHLREMLLHRFFGSCHAG